jgi:hypothetical protein
MFPEYRLYYVGTCVRFRDGTAFFDVLGQLDKNVVRELPHSSHKLFPPNGEIEFRGVAVLTLKPGDCMAFQIEPYGPPGQSKFRATDARRLIPFEDLSKLGSSDKVRRLLVEDGRVNDIAGDRVIRIDTLEMIQVRIEQSVDGRWRPVRNEEASRLPVWLYDRNYILALSDGTKPIELIDPQQSFHQIGTTNWSSDADIVRRIVKALYRVDEPDNQPRRKFADALIRYADQLERGRAGEGAVDPTAAREVVRIRKLASLLQDEQDVLQSYFDILKSDPEVQALIDSRISAAVQEAVAAEKAAIAEKIAVEVDREFASLRARRLSELEKSIEELTSEMMSDFDRRSAARAAEIETNANELQKRRLDALEEAVGAKRTELEFAVSELERRKTALESESSALETTQRDLSEAIAKLKTEEDRAIDAVQRLTSVATALGRGGEPETRIYSSIPAQAESARLPAEKMKLQDLDAAVAQCQLLTDLGKKLLVRFATLMVAGEVPVLQGAECDDFLEIAQTFISGGRCARLEADPTIISLDDLWIRPGTHAATPLRAAAVEASGENPTTQLCVISRADVSGAQFWYPALADRVLRGELPRSMLVCVTIADKTSEEVKAFAKTCIVLDVEDVIASKAAAVAPAVLHGQNSKRFELDVGGRPTEIAAAIPMLASLTWPLGIREAERVARIYVSALLALNAQEAEDFAREIAAKISSPVPSNNTSGTPGLKVVPLGGVVRA